MSGKPLPRLHLTVMSGPADGQRLELVPAGLPPSVSIGRSTDNAIVLTEDPDVSRRHARIVWLDQTWTLEDRGSTNGTYVGEFGRAERVHDSLPIAAGQIFRVGLTRFRLEDSEESSRVQVDIARAKRIPDRY